MLMFVLIIGGATLLAIVISFILSAVILKPLGNLISATGKLSNGELGTTIEIQTGVNELDKLAVSFNEMSRQLDQRDKSLTLSNEMLEELNKRYIDLIGFVSHELKGAVGTIVMNVCSVCDGFLGAVNEKQKKALDGAIRNLDYLAATVKKFLSLGKIEKGELTARKTMVGIKNEVFDVIVNSLTPAAERKNISIKNEINED